MGIVLFFVSIALLALLIIPGFVASVIIMIVHATKGKFLKMFWKQTNDLFMAGAISVDVFGNVFFQHLFDIALIKKGGYRFGRLGETISSALGKNKELDKLEWFGKLLANTLDWLDPNHCIKSIQPFDDDDQRIRK